MEGYQEKERLRYLIQSRRIANGLGYMQLQKDPVPKPAKEQVMYHYKALITVL